MNTDFDKKQDQLREELRSFLSTAIPPGWVGIWHDTGSAQSVSDQLTLEMGRRRWLTYHWPREYNGQGGSIWDHIVVQEELFSHHEPRGSQYMGVNWIGPVIMQFGTTEQKERYLPEIAKGAGFWAQLFSEPDAGSDLAAVRTRARPVDGGYIVDGEKIWTSYANTAKQGFLLARTGSRSERHRGLTVFLIDMASPGITVRHVPSAIGYHRLHSVTFEGVRLPASDVLGEVGAGWTVAMAALPFERVGNARYARTTRILGFLESELSGSEDAVGTEELAELLALGRATELMNYKAASLRSQGKALGWEASAAFALNAKYEQAVAALAQRVFGYQAFVATPDSHAPAGGEIESFVALQAPTVTIQAGTYQMQMSLVAQQALGLPRSR
jgi:alkylation response protein AidB-like acyl-CoA dehydrogenase